MGKKHSKRTNNKEEVKEEKTKIYKVKPSKKNKKEKNEKKPKKKKRFKILKRIILTLFILCLLAGIAGVGIIAGIFFSDKYKVTREELEVKNFNTTVVDSDGTVIATINGNENRKWVTMEQMPEYLPKMFIALEDERFYEHSGIDIKRTLGATIQFLLKRGSSNYGGSTITQQLIKNTFEDKDDEGMAGVERKIREMARAYNTEQVLSKDEILESYLNKIFMGGTYYGVQTASEYYFSKDVKDLSIAEAAYLVTINDSPNAYKPFSEDENDRNKIKNRLKIVLTKFKEMAPTLGYDFTEEAYNAAMAEVENGLAFNKGDVITNKASYSYHTDAAIDQVVEEYAKQEGLTEKEARIRIENNGYKIYTTQVSAIQEIMENEFLQDKYIVYGKETNSDGELVNEGHTQAAMVIIDPSNGYVVGCMGGLGDDSNAVGINRATRSNKQPGSSIKPIGVVAPALEKGIINAATVYDDDATTFRGGYNPHNSGGYNGLLTVRHAVEHSSNIVHVKIMAELGAENSVEFLREMNFDKISDDDIGLPLALGATAVTPLQMASAYAMIDNNGVYIEPTFYTKVEDMNGNVVLEAKQEQKRMMSEANAYVLKEILTEPVTGNGGTATTCWIRGMEVGAKTGSTDDYKDRWLCGITPYYAASCWFGFDKQERPAGISGNAAATIWGSVMRAVHEDLPGARFDRPSGVITARICLDSGCIATDSCENTETEYFASGNVPKQCEGHQKAKICKESNMVANEYCPDTEEVIYLVKPAKENTNLWRTKEDGKYDTSTDICGIHKAPDKVKMIDVVGKTSDDAKKAIEALGLKVEIKTKEDKNKKDGVVLEQSVKKDTQIEKGKTITLTINKIEKTKTNTVVTNTVNENTTNANTVNTNTAATNTVNTNTTT